MMAFLRLVCCALTVIDMMSNKKKINLFIKGCLVDANIEFRFDRCLRRGGTYGAGYFLLR
jgi:hypothetical protein